MRHRVRACQRKSSSRELIGLLAIIALATGCSDEKPGVSSAKPNAKDEAKKSPSAKDDPIPVGKFEIDRVDENRYVIDDEAVIQVLLDGLAGAVRVTKVDRGYRIDQFAESSLLGSLGLQKGDIVVTVNDGLLTDLNQARRAFAQARTEGSIRVAIDRKGASVKRRYYLRRTLDGFSNRSSRRYSRRKTYGKADYSFEAVLTAMRTGVKKLDDTQVQVDREIMTVLEANDKLLKDGLGYVGLDKGYAVEDEYSVYKVLGLTKWDVVTKLNGVTADSKRAVRRLLSSQGRAEEFSITVNRLKEPLTVRYKIVDGLVDKQKLTAAVDKWKEETGSSYDPYSYRSRYSRGSLLSTPTPSSLSAPATTTVKKINDTTYELTAKAMKDVWSSPYYARGARIIPSIKLGKRIGFKLFSIRPTSGFRELGFENGDTITSMNGTAMDSPVSMYTAANAMKANTTCRIEVLRRGKPVTLTYYLK